MTFDPSDDYNQNRVCLGVTGEFQGHNLEAYCSPDASGDTFFADGERINEVSDDDLYGGPFPFDIVLLDSVYPNEGEMEQIRDEVGDALAAQFEGKIDAVYDIVQDSDDPLQSILEADDDDLIADSGE